MIDTSHLECNVFLQSPLTRSQLQVWIANSVDGVLRENVVVVDHAEIHVECNEDWDSVRLSEFPDGFLFFRYSLEFYRDPEFRSTALNIVAKVLTRVWNEQWPAVASCDYEDQLPHKGGYKSKDLPWIDAPNGVS